MARIQGARLTKKYLTIYHKIILEVYREIDLR